MNVDEFAHAAFELSLYYIVLHNRSYLYVTSLNFIVLPFYMSMLYVYLLIFVDCIWHFQSPQSHHIQLFILKKTHI